MNDPLATYLNDHLAGAGLAIDLLQAMKSSHDDDPLSQFASTILVEVEQGESMLRTLQKASVPGRTFSKRRLHGSPRRSLA